jgi:GNAT superfamily N-acetyltransferase
VDARRATRADEDRCTAALVTAFAVDPVWGPALPVVAGRDPFWRFFVRNATDHRSAWLIGDGQAVAIWSEPGVVELDESGEAALERLVVEHFGPAAPAIVEVLDQLDAVHPTEPHHYLSLLATHDDHRGQGLGMALLAENLRAIDAVGQPAYLESTNPANLERYASVGFEPRDEMVVGGEAVTTMWREPRR